MPLNPPVPTPHERANRLRAYLARQHWALHREWTQQQEDAWWVLNELDQLLQLIQRKCDQSDVEVRLTLESNGRFPRSRVPALPVSPSQEF